MHGYRYNVVHVIQWISSTCWMVAIHGTTQTSILLTSVSRSFDVTLDHRLASSGRHQLFDAHWLSPSIRYATRSGSRKIISVHWVTIFIRCWTADAQSASYTTSRDCETLLFYYKWLTDLRAEPLQGKIMYFAVPASYSLPPNENPHNLYDKLVNSIILWISLWRYNFVCVCKQIITIALYSICVHVFVYVPIQNW